jgi:hypothetical protein
MTAINCIRLRKSVILMTDAAYYDDEGVIHKITDKSIAYDAQRAAIAVRGRSGFLDELRDADLGAMCSSFEEMAAKLPAVASEIVERCQGEPWWGDARQEIVLAGWSAARKQGESYMLFTQDHVMGDGQGGRLQVPAFELVSLPAMVGAPSVTPELTREYGLNRPPRFGEINPHVEGISLMQAQRRSRADLYYSTVGGFIRLHTVSFRGVKSEIIHVWPDAVGSPIRESANDLQSLPLTDVTLSAVG